MALFKRFRPLIRRERQQATNAWLRVSLSQSQLKEKKKSFHVSITSLEKHRLIGYAKYVTERSEPPTAQSNASKDHMRLE
jgi:hypothetical protein